MAAKPIANKKVDELRHLIEGVAKNVAERVYGPQGPEWETQFVDFEEVPVQIGKAVSRQMSDQALQRQAARPVPTADSGCPSCGQLVRPAGPCFHNYATPLSPLERAFPESSPVFPTQSRCGKVAEDWIRCIGRMPGRQTNWRLAGASKVRAPKTMNHRGTGAQRMRDGTINDSSNLDK